MKQKHIVESQFLMSVNYSIIVIQIAAVSTGQVVLIYIYMDVSIYWHRSVLCVFVCMCVLMCVWYQIIVPAKDLMCQISIHLTHEVNQGKSSGVKVPRLDISRSIISLNQTTHQIWYEHPSNQRNKTQKGGFSKI